VAGQSKENYVTFYPKTDSESKNILISLLAGLGAGIIVGLAIAPKSGEQIRAEIGNTVDDYVDAAGQKAEELRKSAAALAHRGLKEVQKSGNKAEENIKEAVSGTFEKVNTAAESST
jgi:gas vesicle protein